MIPGLALDEDRFGYEGKINLSSWKGFQSRNGPYGAKDSENPSDGTCWARTGGDASVEEPQIEDFQTKAYSYLIENQIIVKEEILRALLNEYPKIQELYGYDSMEKEEYMPNVTKAEDFKGLIGIANIHFLNVVKDDVGYIGFEFGCSWDEEHGLGVMTHKNRIIKIGGADTAFLSWVAEEDLSPK